MPDQVVQAPISLLLDPGLTPSAKLLWLAVRAQAGSATPTRLASASSLTLATVRQGLAQLDAAGWYSPTRGAIERAPSPESVQIPAGLLSEPEVRPHGKLLYGIIQTERAFRENAAEFTFKALSALSGVSVPTVRHSVRELAASGWIKAEQANQLAPIRITLRSVQLADVDPCPAETETALLRLRKPHRRGETIMREYLSLLIDSDHFEDDARPSFLVNPMTGERMELDRFYPPSVAFEFNGPQHFQVTEKFPSKEELALLQARDLMKEALCARRGVRLVVIQEQDLTLEGMQEKVGNLLPLRDLQGRARLVKALKRASRFYRW